MQNLKLIFAALVLLVHVAASAQNMGIGTDTPTKKLSVAGSIAVDHNNANTGTLDSAALVFGTSPSLVGIFSQKTPGTSSYKGLDFWTNGERRMIISESGTVGINVAVTDPSTKLFVGGKIGSYSFESYSANIGNAYITGAAFLNKVNINGNAYNDTYRLTVNNGPSYFGGNIKVTGTIFGTNLDLENGIDAIGDILSNGYIKGQTIRAVDHMSVGGIIDPTYRLRVYDGNSRFGGNVQVTGNLDAGAYMAVGGAIDPVYRLRVYNGNSRFGGDVQVTGNLDVGEITTSTINGTGVVHSAGSSSLSMGFNSVTFNTAVSGGNQTDITVNITDFDGGADDVRVMIGQFVPDPLPQYANWHDFSFHVHSVDPVNDTCKVRLTNTTGANLSIKGTLYLVSVVKD